MTLIETDINTTAKGICRLSLIPVRLNPDSLSEMTSQILFGEHYSILDTDPTKKWLYVELYFDKFKGWMSADQHFSITEDYYKQINLSDYKVCTDVSNTIYFKKKFVNILIGSVLPIATNELFKLEEQVAYNGESKSLTQKREFGFLKEQLKKYVNAPHLLGGKTPFGIDASGFVQQVFKICGYRLPRTLTEQLSYGAEVADFNDIMLGDIVFINVASENATAMISLEKTKYIGVLSGCVQTIDSVTSISRDLIVRRILREDH